MTWRQATFAVWIGLAAVLVVCEVAVLASRGRLPRVGELVTAATAHRAARAILLLGWMWLGWHAFAR
jgi:hypothetical protein